MFYELALENRAKLHIRILPVAHGSGECDGLMYMGYTPCPYTREIWLSLHFLMEITYDVNWGIKGSSLNINPIQRSN